MCPLKFIQGDFVLITLEVLFTLHGTDLILLGLLS